MPFIQPGIISDPRPKMINAIRMLIKVRESLIELIEQGIEFDPNLITYFVDGVNAIIQSIEAYFKNELLSAHEYADLSMEYVNSIISYFEGS